MKHKMLKTFTRRLESGQGVSLIYSSSFFKAFSPSSYTTLSLQSLRNEKRERGSNVPHYCSSGVVVCARSAMVEYGKRKQK
jgi:hypothetical protein